MTAFKHGTSVGYNQHGCKCGPCRVVGSREKKRYRLRVLERGGPLLVDSTGTLRRMQALVAIGWPVRLIAEHAGVNEPSLQQFFHTAPARTSTDRAAVITRVFEELCMTPGPSKQSITVARKRWYAPPLAWDDIDHDEAPVGMVS